MAQGRAGGVLQNGFRTGHLQQEGNRIQHLVLHLQGHADNIGVAGEHRLSNVVAAILLHVDLLELLDDRRTPAKTGIHGAVVFTKTQHHGAFALIHLEKADQGVDHHADYGSDNQYRPGGTAPTAGATAGLAALATEYAVNFFFQILQGFIQIRRPLVTASTPRILRLVAAGFIPRHVGLQSVRALSPPDY